MSILRKISYRTLKERKARTAVTVIGIFLSSMMMCCVMISAASLHDYMVRSDSEIGGDWYAAAYNTDLNHVEKARASRQTEAIATMESVGYSDDITSVNDYKPYIYVAGADSRLFRQMKVRLLQGRFAENDREIVIPEHLFTDGGVKLHLGDSITLGVGQRVSAQGKQLDQAQGYKKGERITGKVSKTYTVTGIVERPPTEPYQGPGYSVFTVPSKQAGSDITAFVKSRKAADIQDYMDTYFLKSGTVIYNNELLTIMGVSRNIYVSFLFYLAGIILAGLILTGSIALIYNAFSISVKDRIHQLGMLSSVGATKKQITEITLLEGVSISLAGIPAGILAGTGLMAAAIKILNHSFRKLMIGTVSIDFHLIIRPEELAAAALITFLTVMISVWLPAWRAGKSTAIDAVRLPEVSESGMKLHHRSRSLGEKLFGLSGVLAGKYYRRDRRRYRATVISLVISIVLFVSASAVSGYLDKISSSEFGQKADYDVSYISQVIKGSPNVETDKSNYSLLKSGEAITDASFSELVYCHVRIPVSRLGKDTVKSLKRVKMVKGRTAVIPAVVHIMENKSFNGFARGVRVGRNDVIAVGTASIYSSADDRYHDIVLGSRAKRGLLVMKNKTRVPLTVKRFSAVLPWDNVNDFYGRQIYMMSADTAGKILGNYENMVSERCMVFKSYAPKITYDSLRKICQNADMNTNRLYNKRSSRDSYRSMVKIIGLFSYGFIILISLIAAANVINTISTNIITRRKDLALFRAIGIDKRGLRRAVEYECLLYGAGGLMYGIPIAILASWGLWKLIFSYNAEYVFPLQGIIISILSVFAVVFATMLYAVRRSSREEMIEILKRDAL